MNNTVWFVKNVIFAGGEWSFVEERNFLEAPSWKVRLQVNMVLNGSGSQKQFDSKGFRMIEIGSWTVG